MRLSPKLNLLKPALILRIMSIKMRNLFQSKIVTWLDNNRFNRLLLMIFARSFSIRYTLGGLRGYLVNEVRITPLNCLLKLSNFRLSNDAEISLAESPNTVKPTYVRERYGMNTVNLTHNEEVQIVAVIPDSWSIKLSDYGFPHLLHLQRSASQFNLNVHPYYTSKLLSDESVENFYRQVDDLCNLNPKVIFISGHKSSYFEVIERFLTTIKQRIGSKIFMIFLDDWSDEYAKVALRWSGVVDFFLPYEYGSVIERELDKRELADKVLVEPFPRATLVEQPKDKTIFTGQDISFGFSGSLYLNRLPWLLIIKSYLNRQENKIPFVISSNNFPGRHRNSIEDYFKFFHDCSFTFHFLERTPGIFSFTSSVWDAFSCGSLVIVQVGKDYDPVEDFMIPNQHYLRFSDGEQLKSLLDRLIKDPEVGREIAMSGHQAWKEFYRGNYFYARIMSHAN